MTWKTNKTNYETHKQQKSYHNLIVVLVTLEYNETTLVRPQTNYCLERRYLNYCIYKTHL